MAQSRIALTNSLASLPTSNAASSLRRTRVSFQGLIVLNSALIVDPLPQILDLALKGGLAMVSIFNSFPKVGGLMAYGPNLASMFKRAASYIDRILRGAKPGDLPIER